LVFHSTWNRFIRITLDDHQPDLAFHTLPVSVIDEYPAAYFLENMAGADSPFSLHFAHFPTFDHAILQTITESIIYRKIAVDSVVATVDWSSAIGHTLFSYNGFFITVHTASIVGGTGQIPEPFTTDWNQNHPCSDGCTTQFAIFSHIG